MMRFEIMPNNFDVIEFGCVFRQPFDTEPVCSCFECLPRRPADVDRAVVEHNDNGLDPQAGLGAVEPVKPFQKRDEVRAALGPGRGDDELAVRPVERAIIATFLACPGAGTRRSAPRFAQARAR